MSTSDDPAALRADIEQTRQELGDSVQELAERADVKARAKEKAAEVKASAQETAAAVRRQPGRVAGVAAGFAVVFGGIAFLRRRRTKAKHRRRWPK